MAIGLGIVLIAVGLTFGLGAVHISGMEDYVAPETLGWILVGVGVLAVVVSLVVNRQNSRVHHIEERRIE